MRLFVVAILVVPALAFGQAAKFDTAVTVRVDDDNKALDAAFKDQLGMKQGTRADACWHKAGRLHAKLGFDDGKVTSVEIDQLDDKAANACVTKVLKAIVLANARGHSNADVELDAAERPRTSSVKIDESRNRKVLDNVIDSRLNANLSKFMVVKGGDLGSHESGVGIGTGAGAGTGSGTGSGTWTIRDTKNSKVTVGPPDSAHPATDGELTADEIDRVVRARAGVFRACYQKELAKEPKLMGKVVLKLTIKPDGLVANVAVASTTLKSPAVEACLSAQVLRLKFPAKSGTVVQYPFVFAQGN